MGMVTSYVCEYVVCIQHIMLYYVILCYTIFIFIKICM